VLIEPIDNPRVLDLGKKLAKRLIRGDWGVQFEPSGNFLYRLSVRELEKLMTAMGLNTLAFKGINDFYHPRFGASDVRSLNIGSAMSRLGIAVQDTLCAAGALGYGLGCMIVFRAAPAAACRQALSQAGFKLFDLPRNPYVSIV
jgi:hypothetical protein